MPKKYTKKGGGLWDSFGTTFGNLKNSISSGASNLWNKTKKATSGMNNYNPLNSYNSTTTNDYGYNSPNSSTTSSFTPSYNSPSNNTYDSQPVSSYTSSNGGSGVTGKRWFLNFAFTSL